MIIFFGTFPPPVHGMSNINEKLYSQFSVNGFVVQKINTSPKTLNRNFITLLSRWIPFIYGWLFLLFKIRKGDILYLAPSAGWGQMYDVVTVLIAKLKGTRKLLIHHHSIKYLEQANFINKIFFSLTKNTSTHIVLCEKMAEKLQNTYPGQHTFILSNFSILFSKDFTVGQKVKPQKNEFKIGYLSNITKEKGGWIILKLAKEIKKRNISAKVMIAGPCYDSDLECELKASQEQGLLTWLGPVYSAEKQRFFDDIDIFVFPTQYENEAEPLVIWESIYNQVPVISYKRGCISSQVQLSGIVLDQKDDFISSFIHILENWLHEPTKYQNILQETHKRYMASKENADLQWKNFLRILQ